MPSASVADRGQFTVGVHNATDFLQASTGGRALVEAKALHQGRSQQLWQVVITDEASGKVLARGMLRGQNPDLPDTGPSAPSSRPGSCLPGGNDVIAKERSLLGRMSREEKFVAFSGLLVAKPWVTRAWLVEPFVVAISDGMIAACGALLLFLLPAATPPNAIIYGTGKTTIRELVSTGLAVSLMGAVLITAFVLWWAPVVFAR